MLRNGVLKLKFNNFSPLAPNLNSVILDSMRLDLVLCINVFGPSPLICDIRFLFINLKKSQAVKTICAFLLLGYVGIGFGIGTRLL